MTKGQFLHTATDEAIARLCMECALCCNGVLFKDVELQPGDNAGLLKAHGLPLNESRRLKFPQPCAALSGCSCLVYGARPVRCREFECMLLRAVVSGQKEATAALRTIRETQKRADKVRRLLRALGDGDEARALSLRFRRTKRRLEAAPLTETEADAYGELTLAVHDLNLTLQAEFYP